MPLYRYHCDDCGHVFTLLEPVNGNSLVTCVRCGRLSAYRALGRVGVVYKGSGFHSTDYRRNGRGRAEEKGKREGEGGGEEARED